MRKRIRRPRIDFQTEFCPQKPVLFTPLIHENMWIMYEELASIQYHDGLNLNRLLQAESLFDTSHVELSAHRSSPPRQSPRMGSRIGGTRN